MRTLLTLTLALALVPLTATAQEVTFTRKQAGAGDTRTETKSMQMSMSMDIKQGEQVMQTHQAENTEKEVTRTSILAVDEAGKANHVEVTFTERTKSEVQGGVPREAKSPVAGKSYEGRFEGGAWSVTSAGAPAPAAEAELAEGALEQAREEKTNMDFLVGKTVQVGETIELPPEVSKEILSLDDPEGRVTRFVWTLKETKDGPGFKTAVFDVEAGMAFEKPGLSMTFTLTGVFEVGVDTLWPVRMKLAGPIDISGGNPQAGMTIEGDGTMTIDMSAAYDSATESE